MKASAIAWQSIMLDLVRQAISDCRDVYIPSGQPRSFWKQRQSFTAWPTNVGLVLQKGFVPILLLKRLPGENYIADIETERVPG